MAATSTVCVLANPGWSSRRPSAEEGVGIEPVLDQPTPSRGSLPIREERLVPGEQYSRLDAHLQPTCLPEPREPIGRVWSLQQLAGCFRRAVFSNHLVEPSGVVADLALQALGTRDHLPVERSLNVCRHVTSN